MLSKFEIKTLLNNDNFIFLYLTKSIKLDKIDKELILKQAIELLEKENPYELKLKNLVYILGINNIKPKQQILNLLDENSNNFYLLHYKNIETLKKETNDIDIQDITISEEFQKESSFFNKLSKELNRLNDLYKYYTEKNLEEFLTNEDKTVLKFFKKNYPDEYLKIQKKLASLNLNLTNKKNNSIIDKKIIDIKPDEIEKYLEKENIDINDSLILKSFLKVDDYFIDNINEFDEKLKLKLLFKDIGKIWYELEFKNNNNMVKLKIEPIKYNEENFNILIEIYNNTHEKHEFLDKLLEIYENGYLEEDLYFHFLNHAIDLEPNNSIFFNYFPENKHNKLNFQYWFNLYNENLKITFIKTIPTLKIDKNYFLENFDEIVNKLDKNIIKNIISIHFDYSFKKSLYNKFGGYFLRNDIEFEDILSFKDIFYHYNNNKELSKFFNSDISPYYNKNYDYSNHIIKFINISNEDEFKSLIDFLYYNDIKIKLNLNEITNSLNFDKLSNDKKEFIYENILFNNNINTFFSFINNNDRYHDIYIIANLVEDNKENIQFIVLENKTFTTFINNCLKNKNLSEDKLIQLIKTINNHKFIDKYMEYKFNNNEPIENFEALKFYVTNYIINHQNKKFNNDIKVLETYIQNIEKINKKEYNYQEYLNNFFEMFEIVKKKYNSDELYNIKEIFMKKTFLMEIGTYFTQNKILTMFCNIIKEKKDSNIDELERLFNKETIYYILSYLEDDKEYFNDVIEIVLNNKNIMDKIINTLSYSINNIDKEKDYYIMFQGLNFLLKNVKDKKIFNKILELITSINKEKIMNYEFSKNEYVAQFINEDNHEFIKDWLKENYFVNSFVQYKVDEYFFHTEYTNDLLNELLNEKRNSGENSILKNSIFNVYENNEDYYSLGFESSTEPLNKKEIKELNLPKKLENSYFIDSFVICNTENNTKNKFILLLQYLNKLDNKDKISFLSNKFFTLEELKILNINKNKKYHIIEVEKFKNLILNSFDLEKYKNIKITKLIINNTIDNLKTDQEFLKKYREFYIDKINKIADIYYNKLIELKSDKVKLEQKIQTIEKKYLNWLSPEKRINLIKLTDDYYLINELTTKELYTYIIKNKFPENLFHDSRIVKWDLKKLLNEYFDNEYLIKFILRCEKKYSFFNRKNILFNDKILSSMKFENNNEYKNYIQYFKYIFPGKNLYIHLIKKLETIKDETTKKIIADNIITTIINDLEPLYEFEDVEKNLINHVKKLGELLERIILQNFNNNKNEFLDLYTDLYNKVLIIVNEIEYMEKLDNIKLQNVITGLIDLDITNFLLLSKSNEVENFINNYLSLNAKNERHQELILEYLSNNKNEELTKYENYKYKNINTKLHILKVSLLENIKDENNNIITMNDFNLELFNKFNEILNKPKKDITIKDYLTINKYFHKKIILSFFLKKDININNTLIEILNTYDKLINFNTNKYYKTKRYYYKNYNELFDKTLLTVEENKEVLEYLMYLYEYNIGKINNFIDNFYLTGNEEKDKELLKDKKILFKEFNDLHLINFDIVLNNNKEFLEKNFLNIYKVIKKEFNNDYNIINIFFDKYLQLTDFPDNYILSNKDIIDLTNKALLLETNINDMEMLKSLRYGLRSGVNNESSNKILNLTTKAENNAETIIENLEENKDEEYDYPMPFIIEKPEKVKDNDYYMYMVVPAFDKLIYSLGYATNSCMTLDGVSADILLNASENEKHWNSYIGFKLDPKYKKVVEEDKELMKTEFKELNNLIEEYNKELLENDNKLKFNESLNEKRNRIKEIVMKYFIMNSFAITWIKGNQAVYDNFQGNNNDDTETNNINYHVKKLYENAKISNQYNYIQILKKLVEYKKENKKFDKIILQDRPLFVNLGKGYTNKVLINKIEKQSSKEFNGKFDYFKEFKEDIYTDASKQVLVCVHEKYNLKEPTDIIKHLKKVYNKSIKDIEKLIDIEEKNLFKLIDNNKNDKKKDVIVDR